MTFEEELRRVVDQLAEHLRHEAAGRLQAAMPELYDASQSEQKAVVEEAIGRAKEEAERDFAERIEAVKREASEQVAGAQKEAADRIAASEQQASEQLEAARREHADRIEVLQREAAEQLSAKEREAAEQLGHKDREVEERLSAKDREAAEQLDARSREAAERLEAREREITELHEARNRETTERLTTFEREALERADASSREAAQRLELVESQAAERVAAATAEAELRAHEAGRAEGRKEGRDSLAEGIQALGTARSLSEILDALSTTAKRDTPAVAIVVVHDDHVRTWRLRGFGQDADEAAAFNLALSDAGVIRDAVHSGTIVRGNNSEATAIPSFASSSSEPRRVLAAHPLIVGGKTVAVAYGDGPEEGSGAWQTSLEVLSACAARMLEAMTAFRTAALVAGARQSSPRQESEKPAPPAELVGSVEDDNRS